MLFKIAWIEEEQLGDPLAASATYRKILDADKTPATQTRALRALEKLNAARGDAGGMADVLERQLALADKTTRTRSSSCRSGSARSTSST